MNKIKKIIFLLIIIIILLFASIGLLSLIEKEPPKDKWVEVKKEKTIPTYTGWLHSPDASESGPIFEAIIINTTDIELVLVYINITILDDDGNHTESDAGSDADEVNINVNNFDIFSIKTDVASGEAMVVRLFDSNDISEFENNISINITGIEFGDAWGRWPWGHIDQGVAYQINVSYFYMEFEKR